ncbi:MAG: DUF2157 domain-containing protein [Microcystaceae cyanobacterium]
MNLEQEDFDWAADRGLITEEQATSLWQLFSEKYESKNDLENQNKPTFDFANVAYYVGALIVIAALAFFVTLAWEQLGGLGIFAIAVMYATGFILAGKYLYFEQNLKIPGGLLFTIAVWMTPLAIYGLQRSTGFWLQGDPGVYRSFHTWIKGSWFLMEIGTILASLIALRFIKFPFLTFPLAFCLWYLSMDITPLIYGENVDFRTSAVVSLWYGIACLIVAYIVDLRCRRSEGDYAFWLYLFGLITFWFSLPFSGPDSEWGRFIYFLINLGLMGLSVLLKRRLFMIFGGLGVLGYISYLAFQVFANSLLFPFVLSGLGIAIIYLGVLYQRHYRQLENLSDQLLPPHWRSLLPKER